MTLKNVFIIKEVKQLGLQYNPETVHDELDAEDIRDIKRSLIQTGEDWAKHHGYKQYRGHWNDYKLGIMNTDFQWKSSSVKRGQLVLFKDHSATNREEAWPGQNEKFVTVSVLDTNPDEFTRKGGTIRSQEHEVDIHGKIVPSGPKQSFNVKGYNLRVTDCSTPREAVVSLEQDSSWRD
jgi:hypothetical protein